jgi:putative heme-binding domain-containing protein
MITAIAFAPGREAAGAMLELAHAKGFPMQDLAKWWLMNRKGNAWKTYDIDGSMKALGIYDPEKVKLQASPMPPAPANAPKLDLAQIAALKGDAKNGAIAVGACYTCHHIGAAGVDFGPDLTTYGKQQTTDILIQAIAQPSHTISHGYEGSEIKTTDGLIITGMVLSDSDPLIIKCMGGVVQTIPKSRIASRSKLKTSLMYEPVMLGLTPQGIADIVAYLKGL